MSLRRLIFWLTILAIFAMSARVSMDTDTWWHLRAGQWIVENHSIPQTDPFSYTRFGENWQYPGWLVEVPMYGMYKAFGAGGLNIWTALMVTLAFACLWQALSGGVFLRAFVLILAATVSGVYWAARPYLVTFLFSAIFLWWLEDFHWNHTPNSIRRLWWLPVLMVAWANSHGGFANGFILLGIYWIAAFVNALRQRRLTTTLQLVFRKPINALHIPWILLSVVVLLSIFGVCLNPSGAVMLLYPFKTVSIGALQEYIQEWQSPNFHSLSVQPFIWLWLLTFAAVGISGIGLNLTDFLLVAIFTYLSLLAGRNLALFALAAPLVLTRHANAVLGRLQERFGWRGFSTGKLSAPRMAINWFLFLVLFLASLFKAASVLPSSVNEAAFKRTLPMAAIEYLENADLPGRMFNSYNWGAYLLWALPQYPVFIDGRTDLYNDEIIRQWLQVVRAEPGWQQVLERWQVRLVLLEPHLPVVDKLAQEGWRLVYQDDIAVVYTH